LDEVEAPIERSRPQRRRIGREERRRELIDAALKVFASTGVTATSVDDIVRAAGVAKGTFYLYFDTKDDIVSAVAERMVEGVGEQFDAVMADRDRSPVERILAVGRATRQIGAEPHERDLIEVFHRPENRAIHDRLGERARERMKPTMSAIIADGINTGVFRQQDVERAAVFVLACFSILHDVISGPADVPAAIDELDAFVLRGLGYQGGLPR
jgi:AcrR family transcriptional regulator